MKKSIKIIQQVLEKNPRGITHGNKNPRGITHRNKKLVTWWDVCVFTHKSFSILLVLRPIIYQHFLINTLFINLRDDIHIILKYRIIFLNHYYNFRGLI